MGHDGHTNEKADKECQDVPVHGHCSVRGATEAADNKSSKMQYRKLVGCLTTAMPWTPTWKNVAWGALEIANDGFS